MNDPKLFKGKSGIYCFTNITNGKKYIGQAQDIYKRYLRHKSKDSRTHFFAKAIKKYGFESFVFEVLEECPLELLNTLEERWIVFYDTTNDNRGYNLLIGKTWRGYKHKPESLEKIRQATISRELVGEKNPFYSKKHTEETIKILSKKNSGRKYSEEHCKRLSENLKEQYRTGHRKGFVHTDASKASISNAKKSQDRTRENSPFWNVPKNESSIQKMKDGLKGKKCGENHHGFGKERSEEERKRISEIKKSRSNVIGIGLEKDGVICIFETMKEAGESLGSNGGYINKCIRLNRKCRGYTVVLLTKENVKDYLMV